MAKVFRIGSTRTIPFCCGVVEFGDLLSTKDFPLPTAKKILTSWGRGFLVENPKDELKMVMEYLQKRMSNDPARFYQMWFYAEGLYEDEDDPDIVVEPENGYAEYEANALRLIVQQIPNVVKLGEGHNPNSGNKIDGYLWERF